MTETFKIRQAHQQDFSQIVQIYNTIIEEGGFTADLTPYPEESRRAWFDSLIRNNNILVMNDNDRLAGYCYLSPWRQGRQALKHVAEISFYLSKIYRGRGLGSRILQEAVALAEKKGLTHLLAILLDINQASIVLLKKYGFTIAGHMPGIAQLKDRSCGQYLMIRRLP